MGNKQQKTSNQKEEDPKEIKQPHPDQPSKAPQIQQQPKPCKPLRPLRHYSPVHIIKLQSQTMITGQNGIDIQTEIENQNKMRLVIKDSIE